MRNRARRNNIARHAERAVLDCDGGGEGVDGGFGGRDVGLQRCAGVVERCGDEEDASAGWGVC